MTFTAGTGTAGPGAAQAEAAGVCAECGTPVTGNFCSSCGADVRVGGMLGAVSGGRQSFPVTYLQILRSPIKTPVALANDPTYRQHISFLLSGLAVFALIMVPFFLQNADPNGATANYSESMQTLLKVLSQVGLYAGAVITFVVAYALFHFFAKTKRSLKAYAKLYCLAFGFTMPLYALYDYVVRGVLGGVGMSSFLSNSLTPEQLTSAPFFISFALTVLMLAYFIAIHRRFWQTSIWKAGALYATASLASYHASFWIMYFVGYWAAVLLIRWGVVSV